MAADWIDRRSIVGLDRDVFEVLREEMVSAMRKHNPALCRMTLLPDAVNPSEVVLEGWRVWPEDQGPPPT